MKNASWSISAVIPLVAFSARADAPDRSFTKFDGQMYGKQTKANPLILVIKQ